MLKPIPLTLALALAAPTLSASQMAGFSCDDSARLTSMLSNTLGAERQGVGLRDPETTMEIWVTQANGEWLIVQTYANGTSCIVAMGEYWENTQSGPA